jgi:very-short-patch-repair endonuclease
VRYLDAADPVLRIAYEVDGLHHGELAQRDADNDRDLQLAAEWWETVRLTTFRIRRDPETLRRDIARLREQRRLLADAGLLRPASRADVA